MGEGQAKGMSTIKKELEKKLKGMKNDLNKDNKKLQSDDNPDGAQPMFVDQRFLNNKKNVPFI